MTSLLPCLLLLPGVSADSFALQWPRVLPCENGTVELQSFSLRSGQWPNDERITRQFDHEEAMRFVAGKQQEVAFEGADLRLVFACAPEPAGQPPVGISWVCLPERPCEVTVVWPTNQAIPIIGPSRPVGATAGRWGCPDTACDGPSLNAHISTNAEEIVLEALAPQLRHLALTMLEEARLTLDAICAEVPCGHAAKVARRELDLVVAEPPRLLRLEPLSAPGPRWQAIMSTAWVGTEPRIRCEGGQDSAIGTICTGSLVRNGELRVGYVRDNFVISLNEVRFPGGSVELWADPWGLERRRVRLRGSAVETREGTRLSGATD